MFSTRIITIVIFVLILGLAVAFVFLLQSDEITLSNQEQTATIGNFDEKLVFSCWQADSWGIYYFDESTRQLGKLIDGELNEHLPIVSPERNRIYFYQEEEIYNRLIEYWPANGQTNNLIFSKNDFIAVKISPDNEKILYLENEDSQQNLFYYDLIEDKTQKVVGDAGSFAWFTDSAKFVYVKDKILYLVNIDSQTGQLAKEISIISNVDSPVSVVSSPNAFLAVSETDEGVILVLVNTKQKTFEDFSQIEFATSLNSNFDISYAPDQSKIMLVKTNTTDNQSTVWLIGSDGREVQAILDGIQSPIWSSDSQHIYFSQMDSTSQSHIWFYDLTTKQKEQLTDFKQCRDPHLSY